MKAVEIELPSELVELFGSEDAARRGDTHAIVFDLVRQGKISRAKAAELLGIALGELPEILSRYRIPWFDYSADELRKDVDALGPKSAPRP